MINKPPVFYFFLFMAMFFSGLSVAQQANRTWQQERSLSLGDKKAPIKLIIYHDSNSASLSYGNMARKLKLKALGDYTILSEFPKVHVIGNAGLSYVSRRIKVADAATMVSIVSICQSRDGALYVTDAIGAANAFSKKNIDTIVKKTLSQCKQKRSKGGYSKKKVSGASSKKTSIIKNKKPTFSVATAPNQGVKPSQVKAVLYTFRQYTGAGGFLKVDEDYYVLFKDGWSYLNPSVPVVDLNVELSRKYEPKKWGKWRKSGGKYQVYSLSKKKWVTLSKPRVLTRPKKNKKYSGAYSYARASGNIWYGAVVSKGGLKLSSSGQYEGWSFSQYGGASGSSSVFMVQYCNKDGGKVVSSSNSVAITASSQSSHSSCANDPEGSYFIDGYMIQFVTKTGLVTRLPFYELSKKRITVGVQIYSKK